MAEEWRILDRENNKRKKISSLARPLMRAFTSVLHFLTAGTHTGLGLDKVLFCCYSSAGFVTGADNHKN